MATVTRGPCEDCGEHHDGYADCPATLVPCPNHDSTEGPHHSTECCYYADERDE